MLELITDYWNKVGISLFIRTSQRDIFRSRAIARPDHDGDLVGHRQWRADGRHEPRALAPTHDDQLQWPLWGNFYVSGGEEGDAPDHAGSGQADRTAEEVARERGARGTHRDLARDAGDLRRAGLLDRHRQQALQPVLASSRTAQRAARRPLQLRPDRFLGIYMPDTFWYGEEG